MIIVVRAGACTAPESLLLTLLGGALAMGVAQLLIRLLPGLGGDAAGAAGLELGTRVLAFTAVVSYTVVLAPMPSATVSTAATVNDGDFASVVLRVLQLGPMHGWGITEVIEHQSARLLSVNQGSRSNCARSDPRG